MKTYSFIICFCIFLGTYLHAANFSGDINVGAGQTYTSLTQDHASGLFKSLNEGNVTGNITIYITSDLSETGAVPLNEFASPYTITIKSNEPVLRTISGQNFNSRGLVRFNGADRVTIDGSYNSTGNYLLFNNYATGTVMTMQLQSLGAAAGCTDFVIRNCNFLTGSSGTSSNNTFCIHIGGMNPFDGGANNSNILIENNSFNMAYYGIFVKGLSSYKSNNVTTNNNNFGTTLNSMAYNSIFILDATNIQITNNIITGYTTNTDITIGQKGIYLISSSNAVVAKNRIYGMKTLINGSKGIVISNSSNIDVYNNLVNDIGGPGFHTITSSDNANNVGIAVEGASASINIYYNTINLYGTFNKNMATVSSAIYFSSQCSGINLKNNILTNSILNANNSSARCYSIYNAGTSSVFSSINYNDYYGGGTQYILGYQGSEKATLASWRSASGSDLQSLAVDPQFQSNTQLQPITGSQVLGAGTPIASITADIDDVIRSTTNPAMGAYEMAFALPEVDWCNLESPGSASQLEGLTLLVKAQVQEAGITSNAGQGANIEAWIGWSNQNTDPSTWTNWVVANYTKDEGSNDEYEAIIGGGFPAGTYYFASRFRYNNGTFRYGGYNLSGGGFWNGSSNNSGHLSVTDNAIEWANLEQPGNESVTQGETYQVKASIKVPTVTTLDTESPGILCEIGFWYESTNPDTWPEWQWQQATFLERQGDKHVYALDLNNLFPGDYYLASRFSLCNDPATYGGFSDLGGGFWNGTTNVSGLLTINQLVVNAPYSQDFNATSQIPLGWSYEDVNDDGTCWENNVNQMAIEASNSEAMDDWLFSPGINMQAGVTYTISFLYGTQLAAAIGKLELKYGIYPSSYDMDVSTGFSNLNITLGTQNGYAEITPTTTGVYFLGWHGYSDANQASLFLDDVTIDATYGWLGLVDQYWSNPNNWTSGQVPTAGTNVRIQNPHQVIVDLPQANCKNITIYGGAKLTINPAKGLKVHGTLTNMMGEAGLLIASDNTGTGSLLHNTVGVEGVFQRYIEAADWSSNNDGWHFVSSPIDNQPIVGNWTPTGLDDDYDFYLWDSDDVQWLNQKDPANGITLFERGVGYLVSYQQSKTQVFSGTLFTEDFNSNIPINTDSWIPLGNPYSTALKWNIAGWMLDGYADIAKAWNREMESYIDIFPGDVIPATNGFMGFGMSIGTMVNLQMSIPASARVISTTPFYKSSAQEGVFLKVKEKSGKATQECNIVKHTEASNSFSMQCDSYFNAGYAPKFYALKAGESLSTYALREFDSREIELEFVKNDADEFEFIFDAQKSANNKIVFLTDLKTGVTQNLSINPVYNFTSEASDETKRFILKFGSLGKNEADLSKMPMIYNDGQQLKVLNAPAASLLQILDINGKLIKECGTENNQMFSLDLNLPAGIYIARIAGKGFVQSKKIVLI